jgi:hypothetical protein
MTTMETTLTSTPESEDGGEGVRWESQLLTLPAAASARSTT